MQFSIMLMNLKTSKLILVQILLLISINLSNIVVGTSVKKNLNDTAIPTDEKNVNHSLLNLQNSSTSNISNVSLMPSIHIGEDEIPDSYKTGFYILIGVGLIGLCFIIYRAFMLRLSRAERKYGVQGDRSAQELTPLPISLDDESDNEDQTIYEINRP